MVKGDRGARGGGKWDQYEGSSSRNYKGTGLLFITSCHSVKNQHPENFFTSIQCHQGVE